MSLARTCLLTCALFVLGGWAKTIPTPNVCSRRSTGLFWGWESDDCPNRAVCVPDSPNSKYGKCSCEHTTEVSVRDGSRCAGSIVGRLLAGILICGAVVAFVLLWQACTALQHAHRLRLVQFDFLFITGMLSIPYLVCWIIHIALQAALFVGVPDSKFNTVVFARNGTIMVEALFVMATLLMFGLSVRRVAVASVQLQPLNHQTTRIHVAVGVIVLEVVVFFTVLPLAYFKQMHLAEVVFGLFSLVCVLLYNHTLSWVSRLLHRSRAQLTNKQGRHLQSTLRCVNGLSSWLLRSVVTFFAFSVLFVFVWFLGRGLRNSALLGPIQGFLLTITLLTVLAGAAGIVQFLRTLITARSLNPRGSIGSAATAVVTYPRPHSSQYSKQPTFDEFVFSTATTSSSQNIQSDAL